MTGDYPKCERCGEYVDVFNVDGPLCESCAPPAGREAVSQCAHPKCEVQAQLGQLACRTHWFALPTLAMLEADDAREYLDRCELCGEEIKWGEKIGAVEIEPEYTRDAHARCVPPKYAVYTKDGIDIDKAIEKARAALHDKMGVD